MGINWSAVAGGIGEAVNYHVDKRDEEAKRKRASRQVQRRWMEGPRLESAHMEAKDVCRLP